MLRVAEKLTPWFSNVRFTCINWVIPGLLVVIARNGYRAATQESSIQPRQHLLRPHLDKYGHTIRCQPAHDFRIIEKRRRLRCQVFTDLRRLGNIANGHAA